MSTRISYPLLILLYVNINYGQEVTHTITMNGIDGIKIGESNKDLILNKFGKAELKKRRSWDIEDKKIEYYLQYRDISFRFYKNQVLYLDMMTITGNTFKTKEGITIGNSESQVLKTYGKPNETLPNVSKAEKNIYYYNLYFKVMVFKLKKIKEDFVIIRIEFW